MSFGRAGVFLEQRTVHEEYLVSLLPSVHLLTTLQHRQTIDSPFAARLSLDILPKLATSLDEQIEGRPTPRGDSARPFRPRLLIKPLIPRLPLPDTVLAYCLIANLTIAYGPADSFYKSRTPRPPSGPHSPRSPHSHYSW